jgi:predicted dienelactone hydrolase
MTSSTTHPLKTGQGPSLAERCSWLKRGLATAVLSVGILLSGLASAGKAAERLAITYGPFEFYVPVSSLERFAYEGHIDSRMQRYARFFDEDELDQIRQFLVRPFPLSTVEVGQLTYSSFGEESLRFLGDALQTSARQNGFLGLRGALILAAADPEGLTPINVIKHFPSSTLRINGRYVQHIFNQFTQLLEQNSQAVELISQLADQETANLSPPPDSSIRRVGEFGWRKDLLVLFDRQRQRRIVVDFYQPSSTTPAPVVVFSHGLASNRNDLTDLAENLAANGYAVAVVEHPYSNTQQVQNLLRGLAREVTEPIEFVERPRDITYLLDELEIRNQSGRWQNRLNLQQVGVVGHSFGGYTALALAGADIDFDNLNRVCNQPQFNLNLANLSLLLQCSALQLPETDYTLRDNRIQAAFTFNPIGSALFGEAGLQQLNVPVMVVAGSEDWVAPPLLEQICPFTWLKSPQKYLAVIQGGGHGYDDAPALQNGLLNGLAGPDPATAKAFVNALSLAFFESHLQDNPEAQLLLTAHQAQGAQASPLGLHLISSASNAQMTEFADATCAPLTALAR